MPKIQRPLPVGKYIPFREALIIGCCRPTKGYEKIKAGRWRARKNGRLTVVEEQSVHDDMASLPAFGSPNAPIVPMPEHTPEAKALRAEQHRLTATAEPPVKRKPGRPRKIQVAAPQQQPEP
jgi:hypothetical protein